MKTITLYLAVTGTTYFDQLDRFQGWSGTPLTAAGQQTSQTVGQRLATIKFDTAFASDTSRGTQTARAILAAQANSVEIQTKSALRSPFYGGFEGIERSAVWSGFATKLGYPTVAAFEADQTPTEIQNLIHDHDVDSLAESGDEFWQRYQKGLAQVAATTPDHGRALVIVDAVILRRLRFDITGQTATSEQVAPGTVTVVDQAGDKFTLR
ncbi:histidine phosphatase family protein [Lactiplantibacillus sp. WILCCON 0030]|uniref:Histidine phosphatase family protein n=1 Tax=Lactiplantibacillus brownii TaxID=3069269 RepID=A0ABU1AB30_9LACO|nr:histidine phosphatase family protein [Lactiplantibacillus brownii]MDQ7938174.1 histidine phosphatase family protein [Lactiplantibacillus brownii]